MGESIPLAGDPIEYTYLQSQHPHPKDGIVHFQSKDHRYFLPGAPEEELISVTTFWKAYFPEFPVQAIVNTLKSIHTRFQFWYEHRATHPDPKTYHVRFRGPIWPDKYDVFIPFRIFRVILRMERESGLDLSELDRSALQPLPSPFGEFTQEDVSDAWSRDGTALHLDIERFLNRAPSPVPSGREWNYFTEWLETYHPDWEIVRTEMRLYHPDFNIAGSMDCLARRKTDGKYIVVDWKRSKKLKKTIEEDEDYHQAGHMKAPFDFLKATDRNKYGLQLNTYALFLTNIYEMEVAERVMVCLHPNNHGPIEIFVPDYTKEMIQIGNAMTCALNTRKQEVRELRKTQKQKRARALSFSEQTNSTYKLFRQIENDV